jgi:hypothetical protein
MPLPHPPFRRARPRRARPGRLGLCVVLAWALASLAACEGEPAPDRDPDRSGAAAIQADTRLLEQELPLAAGSQIYLLVDLAEGAILIKGRGLELHRLPILSWRGAADGSPASPFRLRMRPPVIRPKAAGGPDAELDPIELEDMPAAYELQFDPPLVIAVSPPPRESFWLWSKSLLVEAWGRLSAGATTLTGGEPVPPRLRLALSREDARSLAWAVTESMPLLIRRPGPR